MPRKDLLGREISVKASASLKRKAAGLAPRHGAAALGSPLPGSRATPLSAAGRRLVSSLRGRSATGADGSGDAALRASYAGTPVGAGRARANTPGAATPGLATPGFGTPSRDGVPGTPLRASGVPLQGARGAAQVAAAGAHVSAGGARAQPAEAAGAAKVSVTDDLLNI